MAANRSSAPIGPYEPFAKLGSGGQADVFLASLRGPRAARAHKLVVIKCLKQEVAEHSDLVTMFLDEARLAARLHHPNVVQTFEAGASNGQFYLAMEYLDGQPLHRVMRLATRNEVSPFVWAHIASEALTGLHYAHELRDYDGTPLDIVHRDVSPHNVFVTYDGEVKIVDFGIAKASLNNARTETGIVKGKAAYMAPEQAYGDRLDRRVDVFSTGIILWEAIAGRALFEGEPHAVMKKLVQEPIPRVRAVKAGVDGELDAIIARALAKKANDRWQTADEMRAALDAFIHRKNRTVRRADVGQIVATAFRSEREAAHAHIRSYMATLDDAAETRDPTREVRRGRGVDLSELADLREHPDRSPMRDDARHGGRLPSPPALRTSIPVAHADHTPPAASATDPPHRPGIRRAGAIFAGATAGVIALLVFTRARENEPRTKTTPAAASPPPRATPLPPRHTTLVHVTTDPPGSHVAWNGASMGTTPLDLALPLGTQALVFTRDGYVSELRVVDVPADPSDAVEVSAALKQATTDDAGSANRPPYTAR